MKRRAEDLSGNQRLAVKATDSQNRNVVPVVIF